MPIPYGSFLVEAPPDVFTPEDFTAEHWLIAKTTDDFCTREVAPNDERFSSKTATSQNATTAAAQVEAVSSMSESLQQVRPLRPAFFGAPI